MAYEVYSVASASLQLKGDRRGRCFCCTQRNLLAATALQLLVLLLLYWGLSALATWLGSEFGITAIEPGRPASSSWNETAGCHSPADAGCEVDVLRGCLWGSRVEGVGGS